MTSPKRRRSPRNTTRRKTRTRQKTSSNAMALNAVFAVFAVFLLFILISNNSSDDNDDFAQDDSVVEDEQVADRETKKPKAPTKTPEDIFWEKRRKVHQNKDVKGLIVLAQWCEKNNMSEKVNDLYREVLLIDPEHVAIREKMGYVKTSHGWLLREHLAKKGYVLYQDMWYTVAELKQKGLVQHGDNWFTSKEMRKKGYVLMDNEWVSRNVAMAKKEKPLVKEKPVVEEKPLAEEPVEEKPVVEEKRAVKQPAVAEKQPQKDTEEKKEKKKPQSLSVMYNLVKINTPKGLWSQSEEHILQRGDRRRSTGSISLKNEANDMHVTVDSMAFGKRLFHDVGGVRTTGDNIEMIMRGYTTILQQSGYRKVKFTPKGRRIGSQFGATIQFYGKASLDDTVLAMVFSFFKHRANTYCVMISVPKKNYSKSKRDIQLLLRNIQEQ
ncbi:hypothetical protein [Candidatus Uabimicrobium amorphum]|uniref:Uncharacterized protein n=1 Tax=Uabimicrobium amorphum TaxID=2596890 RepID=A0A5S9ITU6_UABAM|nr:hypothetical protein [Candidatus Uabimicrobium amorphum]BBM87471.1 hypothetical protein UABAM_05880 [Candidatus Uabimicrobium amorphum]